MGRKKMGMTPAEQLMALKRAIHPILVTLYRAEPSLMDPDWDETYGMQVTVTVGDARKLHRALHAVREPHMIAKIGGGK